MVIQRRRRNNPSITAGGTPAASTITTETSTTPSITAFTVPSSGTGIAVFIGETPVAEKDFFLYISKNGGAAEKHKMYRWKKRFVNAAAGTNLAFGTSDGRQIKVASAVVPTVLDTPSGVTNTALADKALPPYWSPTAAHVTLPGFDKTFTINSDGTRRIIFISEHDGVSWLPPHFAVLPAAGGYRYCATYPNVALANEAGVSLSITGYIGTTIGGSSATMTLPFTVTGTTRVVTAGDEADFRAKMALAVAGDEIVLPDGTYTLTANISASTFTANVALGNKGQEGILIRSQSGTRESCVIIPNNSTSGWVLNANGATQRYMLKDLKFNVAGITAYTDFASGKVDLLNVRVTGVNSAVGGPLIAMRSDTGPLDLRAMWCQADNAAEDCWDGTGTGSDSAGVSRIQMIGCSGSVAGTTNDNQQVVTTHNGQRLEIYGGNYSDARLNVLENDSNATSIAHCFFADFSNGTRRAGLGSCTLFFCTTSSSSSSADGIGSGTKTGLYFIGNVISRPAFPAGSSIFRLSSGVALMDIEANIISAANGRNFFASIGGSVVERNVLINTSGEALRVGNYVSGATTATTMRNNTLLSSAVAFNTVDTNLPTVFRNNACGLNTNSIANLTAPLMATLTANHNVLDPTLDVDYTPGANDTTGADAAVSSTTYLPTASGNCDKNGDGTLYDHIGSIDCMGMPFIYKSATVSRGARSYPEIISAAELVPCEW